VSGLAIRHATMDDLPEVLGLVNLAAARLHHRGQRQWWYGFGPGEKFEKPLRLGRTLLVVPVDEVMAVATITVSPEGDPLYWCEPGELARAAWYVAKTAVAPWVTGRGLGMLLLRWVLDQAYQAGVEVVRLDAWRDNSGLQQLYLDAGWRFVRMQVVPGKYSGALFEHPAVEDLTARAAFTGRAGWQQRAMRDPLPEGRHVRFVTGMLAGLSGSIHAVLLPDGGQPVHGAAADYPVRQYQVLLDDGQMVTCTDMDVE